MVELLGLGLTAFALLFQLGNERLWASLNITIDLPELLPISVQDYDRWISADFIFIDDSHYFRRLADLYFLWLLHQGREADDALLNGDAGGALA